MSVAPHPIPKETISRNPGLYRSTLLLLKSPLPLSWNEIRDRAINFSREWSNEVSEDAEAKSFLDAFFQVFGVPRRRIGSFEVNVKKVDGKTGYIDMLWPGTIIIEMKSRGKDLDRAHKQAKDYFANMRDADLPRYILVCDFERFRLYDLETDEIRNFKLKDLHKEIKHFGFIAGYETQTYKEQDTASIKAAELMGALHDELKAIGYTGHDLEVLLVRLLFCLFADDTGIFSATHPFERFIQQRTAVDGSDLAARLSEIFEVLNQDRPERLKNLDQQLDEFPYVNGKLFADRLRTASFSSKMRKQLLDCCAFDWSAISPAIFGALFQSIMDDKARRNLGAHYTSEKNILKLIKPLFLDELREEFEKIKKNAARLAEFHTKLRSLTFLDPACGCGNFLVITYRELRLLEMDVLRALRRNDQMTLDLSDVVRVNVDQFYGIEIEEWPAQIAQVAMWLVDHQMNTAASLEFGQHFARIPLKTSAKIVNDNALRIDWGSVVPKEKLSYILGNPPFVGKKEQGFSQKEDFELVMGSIKSSGLLDFVAAWYVKASHFIQNTQIWCAFVSTSSITQGEQVGVLWPELRRLNIIISFAHRTFAWRNEARGVAGVHCTIIGFSVQERFRKTIFEYSTPKGEPHAIQATRINPYLVDAPDTIIANRSFPLCPGPELCYGSFALDDGNYTISAEDREAILAESPEAVSLLRKFVGGNELLYNTDRWCLWMENTDPTQIRNLSAVLKRIEAVKEWRLASNRATTRKLGLTPTRFAEIRQPVNDYFAIPTLSSERRNYIPIAKFSSDVIASNQVYILQSNRIYHFGVIQSFMHMAWVKVVCGRLESRYRYSASIVYNNFPWPVNATPKQKQAIEAAAQAVLDARAKYPGCSLADLYDPLSMPPTLLKAHQTLDRAVDAAYGKKSFATEAARVAFLFEEYQKLTAPLMGGHKKALNRQRS